MTDDRFRKAEFAAWVGIVGNIALALLKGTIGWLANSKALLADAVHSASEVAGSFAVLASVRAAKLPPDGDHPYGLGKAQPIAAILVSVLITLASVEIGISSVKSIIAGAVQPPHWLALIALLISIVVKEALWQYEFRVGNKLNGQPLMTKALEHRPDVYSSLVAPIGVVGAMLGHALDLPWFYYLDPIAGLVVSALVLKMGYDLIMKSTHHTMQHVLHREDSQELVQAVQRVKGVITVDELRAREHGHYVIVDVKISVNPRITVLEGHEIAKLIKQHLMEHFVHVSDVNIHVSPYDPGYPYKNNVDSEQDDAPTLLH